MEAGLFALPGALAEGQMEGNAAVLEAGTAGDVEETTGLDPESELEVLTETDTEEGTTDSATEEDAKTYTQEELDKFLKAELAKRDESHRQKVDNERKAAAEAERDRLFQTKADAAKQARMGLAAREVAALVQTGYKLGEEGKDLALPNGSLQRITAILENQAFQEMHERYSEEVSDYLKDTYPDFAVPQELTRKLERATRDYDRQGMVRAYLDIGSAALIADLSPKLRKQVEEEIAKAATEAGAEAGMKNADKREREGSKPTKGLSGAAGSNPGYDAILANPNAPIAERRAAFKNKNGFDAPF